MVFDETKRNETKQLVIDETKQSLTLQKSVGRDRGVTISRFPYPVLPPPVRFCPFVSRLPPFIVFLLLSCKSRCLIPYSDSNRECFGLVQNRKLCSKSNHFALSSAIIDTSLHHVAKFSLQCFVNSQEGLLWTDFSPPNRKILRPIKMVFDNI